MDIKKDILPAMIQAPSAHNTQPWLFRVRDNSIDVLFDESRHLGVSDPTKRQAYVSLGCTIMNGVVAAAAQGSIVNIEYAPDPATPARLTLSEGAPNEHLSSLAAAIETRRTDRSIFDTQPLTDDEREALKGRYDGSVIFIEDRVRKVAQ